MESPRAMVACSKSLIKSLIHARDGNACVSISDDQALIAFYDVPDLVGLA